MTELQIILGILALVFGGLATWAFRKEQAMIQRIHSEKEDREKAIEVIHSRIGKAKQEAEQKFEVALKEASIARTECHAADSAIRAEFQDRSRASEEKFETSLSRVHSRIDEIKRDMITHDDANMHFKRIEGSLGNSFKTVTDAIVGLTAKVDTICSSMARYDERIKSLETNQDKV